MNKLILTISIFLFLFLNVYSYTTSDNANNDSNSTAIQQTNSDENNSDSSNSAQSKSNKKDNGPGWVLADRKNFFIISDFVIPEGYELHIKIWKNGKETEEYYKYSPEKGINDNGTIKKYPVVDSLCCIKYGKKGGLKPFSIDLNMEGKGLTDLPGCIVENSDNPNNSLKVTLPDVCPNTNI